MDTKVGWLRYSIDVCSKRKESKRFWINERIYPFVLAEPLRNFDCKYWFSSVILKIVSQRKSSRATAFVGLRKQRRNHAIHEAIE